MTSAYLHLQLKAFVTPVIGSCIFFLVWPQESWSSFRSITSRDYYFKIPKDVFKKMFNRATPLQWMLYTNAKLAIALFNLPCGPPLSSKLRSRAYINEIKPGIAIISDASKLKIGKQSIVNRLNCLRRITFEVTSGQKK